MKEVKLQVIVFRTASLINESLTLCFIYYTASIIISLFLLTFVKTNDFKINQKKCDCITLNVFKIVVSNIWLFKQKWSSRQCLCFESSSTDLFRSGLDAGLWFTFEHFQCDKNLENSSWIVCSLLLLSFSLSLWYDA